MRKITFYRTLSGSFTFGIFIDEQNKKIRIRKEKFSYVSQHSTVNSWLHVSSLPFDHQDASGNQIQVSEEKEKKIRINF
jgi:hypothetical protein